jgi:hypothetical protein
MVLGKFGGFWKISAISIEFGDFKTPASGRRITIFILFYF